MFLWALVTNITKPHESRNLSVDSNPLQNPFYLLTSATPVKVFETLYSVYIILMFLLYNCYLYRLHIFTILSNYLISVLSYVIIYADTATLSYHVIKYPTINHTPLTTLWVVT